MKKGKSPDSPPKGGIPLHIPLLILFFGFVATMLFLSVDGTYFISRSSAAVFFCAAFFATIAFVLIMQCEHIIQLLRSIDQKLSKK